jgi:hypothetical protein
MKIFQTIFLLIILSSFLFSCVSRERAICSYAVRNKEVKRTPGAVDTVWVNSFFSKYDLDNYSYFEVAKFYYNGDKKFIIASDLYLDPVRFNLFTGFKRGFSPYDKYEKVNYLVLDENQVKEILNFYEKIQQPIETKKVNTLIDYTITKDFFITFNIYYLSSTGVQLKQNEIRTMVIWINGRKHDMDPKKFFNTLKKAV